MKKHTKIELSILFGVLFAVFFTLAGFESKCDTIKNGVFRLRVVANSDTAYDQNIKLSVRDNILSCTSGLFKNAKSSKEAKNIAKNNLDIIEKSVKDVLDNTGVKYDYKCLVKKEYFGIRDYDDFSLPAGEYDSLVVYLGNAKGHNWWCVLFPGVCLKTAGEKQKLEDVFSNEITDVTNNKEKYYLRFKSAEIYEYIKEKIKK
ncbi:MAG: stage II sporulation protein R [Clostridia bacterium]|nr:stage II sporulation protein R [Clostridia bacterium]